MREAIRGHQRSSEVIRGNQRSLPGREDGVRIIDEGEPPALPEQQVLEMTISRGEQSIEES